MTSLLPAIAAEIAFGNNPGDTSPSYSDLRKRLFEFNCFHGRNGELDVAEAGGGTLILDNQDRALEPNFPGVYANFITNPSFEVDLTGWSTASGLWLTAGAALSRIGSDAKFGGFCAHLTMDANTEGMVHSFTATKGKQYIFSVYLKKASGSGNQVSLGIGQNNANMGYRYTGMFNITSDWQRYSVEFVAGGTGTAEVAIRVLGATSIAVLVDGAMVEERTQPISNPGAEDAADWPGQWWGYYGEPTNVTLTRDTVSPLSGSAPNGDVLYTGPTSVRVNTLNTSDNYGPALSQIPVKGNQHYRMRVWIRHPNNRPCALVVNEYANINATQFNAQRFKSITTSSDWTEYTFDFITEGTTRYAYLYVIHAIQPPVIDVFWVDMWSLIEMPLDPSPYIDGTMENARWAGGAHSSWTFRGGPYYPNIKPIRPARIRVGSNLIQNPLFASDASDWFSNPGASWTRMVANPGETPVGSGTFGRLTVGNPALNPNAGTNNSGNMLISGGTQGRTFTLSTWVKSDNAAGRLIELSLYAGGGLAGEIFIATSQVKNLSSRWQRVSVTGTLPNSDHTYIRFYLISGGIAVSGDQYDIVGAQAEERPDMGPYLSQTYTIFTGDTGDFPPDYEGLKINTSVPLEDAFAELDIAEFTITRSAELAGTRINAILDAVGWPAAKRTIEAGQATVIAKTYEHDISALAAIQEVVRSDGGIFFIDKSGNAVFHDRHHRWISPNTTIKATFSNRPAGIELPYAKVTPAYVKERIRNDISVEPEEPLVKHIAADATSKTQNRHRSLSISVISSTQAQVQAMAEYLLYRFKDPIFRPDDLIVEPAVDNRLWDAVLSLNIGDRIEVKTYPAGPTWMDSLFIYGVANIEKIEYRMGADRRFQVAFKLSPAQLEGFWQLGTSALGVDTRVGF